ncbi:MAG: hypothetical protein ABSB01_21495 [Streptosporangiaceae bacterium]
MSDRASPGAHGGDLGWAELCGAEPEHAGALDGRPDPAFGHHCQHRSVDEAGHVAVQAGGRHGRLGREASEPRQRLS